MMTRKNPRSVLKSFDGYINIEHPTIFIEKMPLRHYIIYEVLSAMSDEELDKVIEYIDKLTQGRLPIHKLPE